MASLGRLRRQIEGDRAALSARLSELEQVRGGKDAGSVARAAWALHHAYTAIEAILERVARELEGGPPTGPEWHRELLDAARLEIPGERPAILSDAVVSALHETRSFRHFARHGYGGDFDGDLLAGHAERLLEIAPALRADLDRFDALLAAAAES
jgi:hypothetical protein